MGNRRGEGSAVPSSNTNQIGEGGTVTSSNTAEAGADTAVGNDVTANTAGTESNAAIRGSCTLRSGKTTASDAVAMGAATAATTEGEDAAEGSLSAGRSPVA